MNKFVNAVDKTHEFLKDNVVLLLGSAIIGSFVGGMIVAQTAYKEGYTDAIKDLIAEALKSNN